MAQISSIPTPDGITWHVAQQGQGPDVVLIPSGEGDYASFITLSTLLSSALKITTFDMPGFSHTTCPPDALKDLTPAKVAAQIVGLMDALSIPIATFYGCSSGGLIALALGKHHPARVNNVIIHEIPLSVPTPIQALRNEQDDKILVHNCRNIYANFMNEDNAAWEALGTAYHERLDKNFVVWARNYFSLVENYKWTKEDLKGINVNWTVGALSPMGLYFDNVVLGVEAGIQLRLMPSKHFPQVSVPKVLAAHIRGCVEKL